LICRLPTRNGEWKHGHRKRWRFEGLLWRNPLLYHLVGAPIAEKTAKYGAHTSNRHNWPSETFELSPKFRPSAGSRNRNRLGGRCIFRWCGVGHLSGVPHLTRGLGVNLIKCTGDSECRLMAESSQWPMTAYDPKRKFELNESGRLRKDSRSLLRLRSLRKSGIPAACHHSAGILLRTQPATSWLLCARWSPS
jgi:hypothetical protein